MRGMDGGVENDEDDDWEQPARVEKTREENPVVLHNIHDLEQRLGALENQNRPRYHDALERLREKVENFSLFPDAMLAERDMGFLSYGSIPPQYNPYGAADEDEKDDGGFTNVLWHRHFS